MNRALKIIGSYLINIFYACMLLMSIFSIQAYFGGFVINFNQSYSFDNKYSTENVIIYNILIKI